MNHKSTDTLYGWFKSLFAENSSENLILDVDQLRLDHQTNTPGHERNVQRGEGISPRKTDAGLILRYLVACIISYHVA